ncbi:PAS domain-containing hybrid sensor histidine kinase/response regulator [Geoalkalibacter halelectricus]|uniref:histidine kinase n=1 Tax=Geoalkalibacter halelectricus TaxID=2847045 RepID=A0ABY5ZGD0_9BACT|nr:PAS domain-containing hybrid sensor histidine kinase/response regulator [Geoalkalibacter halelectricus]MDO3380204.1 ATP-binding protein [Geoalkalibacter halelectricus]UWZ78225.1 ATP-binding protein [Geoalkalibacter halelectricus]
MDAVGRDSAATQNPSPEERLNRFIGTMDEIVFEFDLRGCYLNVWSENENLLKRPRHELIGKTIDEVIPKDLAQRVHEVFRRLLVTGKPECLEYSMDVPEGTRWFLARISLVPPSVPGAEPTFSYLGRDITEQKHLEQSLRESEKRFHDLVETVGDWVWEVDQDGVYTYSNPRVYDLLGYHPHEVIGTSVFALMPADEARRVETLFKDFAARKQTFTGLENINLHKNGRQVILETSGLPFFDAQGQLLGFRGVDRDITERKANAEKLRLAKEAAEQATEAKSRFLANMSHEIRTPMAAVLGALECLALEELDPESNRCLRMAELAAQSLMDLIGDILDFSRIEAGKLSLKEVPFALGTCVNDVVEMLKPGATRKGLRLNLEILPEVPPALIGDPVRLQQILINLVSNAIKFTESGEIELRISRDEEGGGNPEPCRLRFSVRDTGIGIAPEFMGRLFESFAQDDSSLTKSPGGTGLGLPICKGIVEHMGGHIEATSVLGQGSTFTFTLPLRKAPPEWREQPCAPSPAPARDTSSLQILLGEDDPALRKLMETLLANRGWRFLAVENGLEVIKAWQNGTFDLILMDAQMPLLDGFDAARRIREQEKSTGGHIPIIALTAHAGKECEAQALAAGMDAFLTKPLRMNELYARVEEMARKHKKADPSR